MWQEAARSDQLTLDQILPLKIAGQEILAVRTNRGLFALEDSCPHQKQPLSTGKAKGDKLTCRHHGIEIDLVTGRVVWAMGFLGLDDVKTYAVKEEADAVWVDLP